MAKGPVPQSRAFLLLLLMLTSSTDAVAAGTTTGPTATQVNQAASLLSRYPPGRVPLDGAVFDAIDLLSREGTAGDGVLLRSLAIDEPGPIGRAASQAADEVAERTGRASRLEYADRLPSDAAIDAWIDSHSSALNQARPGPLGRSERQVVAYASLLLAGASSSSDDDPMESARAHERAGRPPSAVAAFAAAAALGEDGALSALAAYGVDAERLLLGMTSPAAGELGLPALNPAAVAVLVEVGSVRTVAVLVERARSPDPAIRSVAVGTLGLLVAAQSLPPGATLAANQCIDAAASDTQPAVRRAAEAALARRD
jgi:hypothetical protein